jgi:transglutaminase/protease-like cytokinesis protein 3
MGLSNFQITKINETAKLKIKKDYEKVMDQILSNIPNDAADKRKLEIVYKWFIENVENIQTNELTTNNGGIYFYPVFYEYKNGATINCSSKECPILIKRAICESYSKAFKDICDRLKIPCEIINNHTHMGLDKRISPVGHAWNIVEISKIDTPIMKSKPKQFTVDIYEREFLTPPKRVFVMKDNGTEKER